MGCDDHGSTGRWQVGLRRPAETHCGSWELSAPCTTRHTRLRGRSWTAAALPPLWPWGRSFVARCSCGSPAFGAWGMTRDNAGRSFPRAALRLPWAGIPPPRWGGSTWGAPAAGGSVSAARRNLLRSAVRCPGSFGLDPKDGAALALGSCPCGTVGFSGALAGWRRVVTCDGAGGRSRP